MGALVAGVPGAGSGPAGATDVGRVGGELFAVTEDHRHLVGKNWAGKGEVRRI